MKIKKMDATFGKLTRASLSLGDGLNVICGDNESGKSTWCGFIRAMLYGINTREQSKSGFLADKERYRPWSGETMHGRMEISWRGRELTIERTGGRTGVMGSAIATDNSTGLAVAEIDVPGESMLGVKKEVFERSAFIGQALLKVENDKGGELERRIVSLAGSGEEDVSYSVVEQRLKGWKNKRRYHSRGEAPELESRIEEIRSKLNLLYNEAASLTMKRAKIEELKSTEAELSRQAEVWKSLRAWEAVNMNEDAKFQAEQAQAELEKAVAAARFGDAVADDELCAKLQDLYQRCVNSEKNYTISIENVRKAEAELADERSALAEFGELAELTSADASSASARAGELEGALAKGRSHLPIILGVIFAAMLAGGAFVSAYLLSRVFFLPLLVAGAAVLVACVIIELVLGAKARKRKAELKSELERILKLYGVSEIGEIPSRADKCTAQKKRTELSAEAAALARNDMDRNLMLRDECREELSAEVKKLRPDAAAEQAPELIAELRRRADAVKDAERELQTAKVRLETIKSGRNLDAFLNDARACEPGTEKPELGEDELNLRLAEVATELRELELDCSAMQARINQVGNPGDLQEQQKKLRDELEVKNLEVSAIELAMDELGRANGEMQRRFAPELEKRAGEIFENLTGGRFSVVEIRNAQMEVFVREQSAAQARDVLELSQGTMDELYLAMRLALSDMLAEDEPIPLVLDDALVNFDDKRMAKALDYLLELAKDRQIIVFTCQNREAEYLAGRENVEIIRL